MWCWPWHAPNRNLVAGLMKSLFRFSLFRFFAMRFYFEVLFIAAPQRVR
jgi:hypothetical protein